MFSMAPPMERLRFKGNEEWILELLIVFELKNNKKYQRTTCMLQMNPPKINCFLWNESLLLFF